MNDELKSANSEVIKKEEFMTVSLLIMATFAVQEQREVVWSLKQEDESKSSIIFEKSCTSNDLMANRNELPDGFQTNKSYLR